MDVYLVRLRKNFRLLCLDSIVKSRSMGRAAPRYVGTLPWRVNSKRGSGDVINAIFAFSLEEIPRGILSLLLLFMSTTSYWQQLKTSTDVLNS